MLPPNCARNLGTWLDSKMNMKKHVSSVCRSCYAQLRHIGHIRQYLTIDATKSIVNSLVTSRIYYCTSLLNGIPKTTLNKIQNVENTAARHYNQDFPSQAHHSHVKGSSLQDSLLITYKAL